MRKLPIPQDYEPSARATRTDRAAGHRRGIRQARPRPPWEPPDPGDVPECADGLASLGRAQPELAAVLRQLIDELDGLAYRHKTQGLLPLAGEPLWHNLPSVWPETGADGTPDLDTVAEWLAWFGDDAQHLVEWAYRRDQPQRLALWRPATGADASRRRCPMPHRPPAKSLTRRHQPDPGPPARRQVPGAETCDRRDQGGERARGPALRGRNARDAPADRGRITDFD